MESLEKELNLDIFLSDKDIKKKKKKYSSTKVKARNFLTNVSYTGVKSVDYENRSFIIDIFSFLILYFNPYNLDAKFETEIEKDYISVLWACMLPESFYNFICRNENIKVLNETKVKFQEAVEIVNLFIEDTSQGMTQKEQFENLKTFLEKYVKMYQFIFGNLFPKYFSKIDDYGIQTKIEFDSCYRSYLYQKNMVDWEKNNQFWQGTINKAKNSIDSVSTPTEVEATISPLVSPLVVKNEVIEIKEEEEKIDIKNKKKMEKQIKKREIKKRKLEEKLKENTKKFKIIKGNK